MQDIFAFEQIGVTASGRAQGRFIATGIRPSFLERLKTSDDVDRPFQRQVLMTDEGVDRAGTIGDCFMLELTTPMLLGESEIWVYVLPVGSMLLFGIYQIARGK